MMLPDDAVAYLEKRDISKRAARLRKLGVINGTDAGRVFGRSGQGRRLLGFPYYTAEGKPVLDSGQPFVRARILGGKGFRAAMPTTGMKFLQPDGTNNHLYLDPARKDWARILGDPSVPLVVTEGELKAMAATEHGITCVAIGGVWNWKTRLNGRSVPLPEFDTIKWSGRVVEIAFDSDAADKPEVMAAQHALALELTSRGASVRRVVLPPTEQGAKVGLDDFLVNGGTFDDLDREPVALVLDPAAPLDTARAFLGARYTESAGHTLHFYRGSYYRWNGVLFDELDPQVLRSELHRFLDGAVLRSKDGELKPFKPNTRRTDDVLHSLRATATLDAGEAPVWLDDRDSPPANEVVAAQNGLIHLPTRRLLPHTPLHFNTSALTFTYEATAPRPERWLRFLDELWPDDPESIAALQEWFGYLVSGDSSQQKILSIVGPKRAGKGTIAGVLRALLGDSNVTAPTLHVLAETFGRECLIGKKLAVMGDVRLATRADQQALAGALLAISGEDAQTIPRKYRAAWEGRLGVRLVVMSNEILKVEDASGALASRFIVLKLTRSFYGREDLGLADALRRELPGILNWSLDGLDRLKKRGHFIQPKSAKEEVELFGDLTSPVSAFLRERCDVAPDGVVRHALLFEEWKRWCEQHGRMHPGTMESLGVALRALLPGLKNTRVRYDGIDTVTRKTTRQRGWAYVGLRIKAEVEPAGRQWKC